MKSWTFLGVILLVVACPATLLASMIDFNINVDDYVDLKIDGVTVEHYDAYPEANVPFSLNLTPGLHSVLMDYANRWGSSALYWSWKDPVDLTWKPVPFANLFSENASGVLINGLRADYSSNEFGNWTVYGEGPIWHDYTPMYQGVSGVPWGYKISGWPHYFSENLSGDLLVNGPSAVPEPSSLVLMGSLFGAVALVARRRKRERQKAA